MRTAIECSDAVCFCSSGPLCRTIEVQICSQIYGTSDFFNQFAVCLYRCELQGLSQSLTSDVRRRKLDASIIFCREHPGNSGFGHCHVRPRAPIRSFGRTHPVLVPFFSYLVRATGPGQALFYKTGKVFDRASAFEEVFLSTLGNACLLPQHEAVWTGVMFHFRGTAWRYFFSQEKCYVIFIFQTCSEFGFYVQARVALNTLL